MLLGWTSGGGTKLAALKSCLAVLEGFEAPKTARRLFIEAAGECGVFVRDELR